ncbi:hypothetical protein M2263_004553 [Providencia alcalifaciens]|nr:hypothetical protein [Providencia alcalifaciens]
MLSTFVLPYTENILIIFSVSLLLSIIGITGNLTWALAGRYFQIIFAKHGRVINYSLSALLIYCAIRILM